LAGPASVLLVEPSLDELLPVVATLTAAGFHVTAAGNFAQARALLDTHLPSMLVTAVRLGLYNGLHLVIRGMAVKPDLAAIVTSEMADPVLHSYAESMGATFMVKPIPAKDLIAAALRTIFARDTSSGAIRPPYERRVHERRRSEHSHGSERRVAERRREPLSLVKGALVHI
jgi:DNA-binding NtrC family response regulator